MTEPSARRPSSSSNRALLKIDRVVLASVIAGAILALLSSIGTQAPVEAEATDSEATAAESPSFP